MSCQRCDDTGWVCENHDNRPWVDSKRACSCMGAGMPCPTCNPDSRRIDHQPPRLPPGLTVTIDRRGTRH
jgi:hypothetical protein